jgi:hypothetical protein
MIHYQHHFRILKHGGSIVAPTWQLRGSAILLLLTGRFCYARQHLNASFLPLMDQLSL